MDDSPADVDPVEASAASEELPMDIKGLMVDPSSNAPIVILKHEHSQVFLPIWIGLFEANAIAVRIEGIEPPRPMTHDLLRGVLEALRVTVHKVVISDLRESTFYAKIHVSHGDESLEIDARPSDAIALALRCEAPIFVLRDVLDKAKAVDLASEAQDEEKLRKWLEEVKPEDLGEYEM